MAETERFPRADDPLDHRGADRAARRRPRPEDRDVIAHRAADAVRRGDVRRRARSDRSSTPGSRTVQRPGFTMSDSLPPFLANDADAYEHFMGRWSTRLADPFLEFAGIQPGDHVLDVGCGTGTISLALAQRGAKTVGLDASETYLDGARRVRAHPGVTYEHGDARRLPYADASFDACVSTLVIDVIPEVDLVAAEMRRVTRPGGVVACATFDFWGGCSVLDLVLDTGAVLDESIRVLRAQIKARPIVWANGQANLWRQVGLVDVVEMPIVLSFDYTDFEDYWTSFSTGPTRFAQRLAVLPSGLQREIEQHVRAGYLADLPDGPRSFAVVVRAVRGTVPGGFDSADVTATTDPVELLVVANDEFAPRRSDERHQAVPRRDDAAHSRGRDGAAQRRCRSALPDVVTHRSGHGLRRRAQRNRVGRGRSDVREARVALLELQLVRVGSDCR